MGLKWTVFFLLSLSLAAKGFDLRRLGAPRGHVDLRNDEDRMKPSDVLKPVVPQVARDLGKSGEDEDEEEHVEHPLPPSGPMSRIVIDKMDSLGKPHPATVDLVMDMKDSKEETSPSPNEGLSQKMDKLKEAAANEKVEDIPGPTEDKPSKESTTEKLESAHESKTVEVNAKDDLKDLPYSKMEASSNSEKRDLKDGVLNAFHHSISGNRKDYFRNAVSMMSRDELDDLHDVLKGALKPLDDDDVDVDEVKEEFKKVVHEFVEKEAESNDMPDDKKEALIEIEHVLDEAKSEKKEEDVKPEKEEEPKQVIKMEDWKKEDIVGGIMKKEYQESMEPTLPQPKVDRRMTLPEKKEYEVKEEKQKEETPIDKVDDGDEEVPAPTEKYVKEETPIDKVDDGDEEVPAPTEKYVKTIIIDQAPEIPDTVDEKKDDEDEKEKPKEEVEAPQELKEKVREFVKSGVMGGILSKDQQEMVEGKKEASEIIADSVVQPDSTDEVIQIVPLKKDSSSSSSSSSSEEDDEDEDEDDDEPKAKSHEVASSVVVPVEKLRPAKLLMCKTTSDESGSDEDSKEISGDNRGGRRGGSGRGRRNKRHSRHYYRRRPYPRHDEHGASPSARRTRRAVYRDGSGSASQELRDFPPPSRLEQQMRTQFRQINDAGPPDPYPRSKAALGLPEITLAEPAMIDIVDDIKEGLRYVLQTRNEFTFPVHGSGTTGAGAVMDNLIEEGDKVLVMSIGYWGDLQANMSERLGANVVRYSREAGTRYQLAEVELALRIHRPDILAMVIGESDTATRQPMDGIGDLCRKYGALLAVDAVAFAGMEPVLMDKMKIDALYTSSNKGLGGVPGFAPVSLSPRAVEKLRNRLTPPRSYSTDLLIQSGLWNTTNRALFQSMNVPVMYALREALASIAEERMEKSFKRHESATKHLARGIEALGLQFFVPNPEDRMIGITAVYPPKGKDPKKIAAFMFRNSNVSISTGLGPTAGRVLRFAYFASNANSQRITNILRALKKAIQSPETDI